MSNKKQRRIFFGQVSAYINHHYSVAKAPNKYQVGVALNKMKLGCNRRPWEDIFNVGGGLTDNDVCQWAALYAMNQQIQKVSLHRKCSILNDAVTRQEYAQMRCAHRATPKIIKRKQLMQFENWANNPRLYPLPIFFRFVSCC